MKSVDICLKFPRYDVNINHHLHPRYDVNVAEWSCLGSVHFVNKPI